MRKIFLSAIVAAAIGGVMPAWAIAPQPPVSEIAPVKAKPIVQIAILLDTSGSMDGLIEQAKSQLWKIVNEFSKAQRGGQRPDIQVALYQYGTPSLGQENGYIKQLVPLTTDLDKVSEELFKLTTDGGDEYCGQVIQKASGELAWSREKDAYKAIFIAGNEPFSQGSVDFHTSCAAAIGKGIVVNTIYCGNAADPDEKTWAEGAALADGSCISIDQNAKVVHIDAPQDKEIADLGVKINSTYIAYGHAGGEGAARQMAQDKNATVAAAADAPVERAVAKASGAYQNSTWDLVDASKQKSVKLEELKDAELPAEMKGLDAKGREQYVEKKQKEREEIQAQIAKLSADREKFLTEKRKELAGSNTLDEAVIGSVRTQAAKTGLNFDSPAPK